MIRRVGRMVWKTVKFALVAGPLAIVFLLAAPWIEHNTALAARGESLTGLLSSPS